MLIETPRADWAARGTKALARDLPRVESGGIVLGAGTLIGLREAHSADAPDGTEHALAILAVTVGRPLNAPASAHARRALEKASSGETALALTHLALAGVGRLADPGDTARRLFIADGLMKSGVSPRTILEALGGGASENIERAYNPDQPRVPAGNGTISGQWTSGESAGSAANAGPPKETDRTQVADASSNWLRYFSPLSSAEAAEVNWSATKGNAPNLRHDVGVALAVDRFRSVG